MKKEKSLISKLQSRISRRTTAIRTCETETVVSIAGKEIYDAKCIAKALAEDQKLDRKLLSHILMLEGAYKHMCVELVGFMDNIGPPETGNGSLGNAEKEW